MSLSPQNQYVMFVLDAAPAEVAVGNAATPRSIAMTLKDDSTDRMFRFFNNLSRLTFVGVPPSDSVLFIYSPLDLRCIWILKQHSEVVRRI
jgi:hypothetical protein